MTPKQYPIRVSTKALVYQNHSLLCSQFTDETGLYYSLPGGGVNFQETAAEALKREVYEETGYTIVVGDLVIVREFITERLGLPWSPPGFHQLELYFLCTLAHDVKADPIELDNQQTGCGWVPLDSMESLRFYPETLKPAIQTRTFPTVYMGNLS